MGSRKTGCAGAGNQAESPVNKGRSVFDGKWFFVWFAAPKVFGHNVRESGQLCQKPSLVWWAQPFGGNGFAPKLLIDSLEQGITHPLEGRAPQVPLFFAVPTCGVVGEPDRGNSQGLLELVLPRPRAVLKSNEPPSMVKRTTCLMGLHPALLILNF